MTLFEVTPGALLLLEEPQAATVTMAISARAAEASLLLFRGDFTAPPSQGLWPPKYHAHGPEVKVNFVTSCAARIKG